MYILDFEKPILEIQSQLVELKNSNADNGSKEKDIQTLEKNLEILKRKVYFNLSAWQKTQIARHPNRLSFLEFVKMKVQDFQELHGDRHYGDDRAVIGGIGHLENIPFMFVGTQKGSNTQENVIRNFGMPKPEGYRKALRLMKLADHFSLPIITLVDTPGAYPGIEAEERIQSEAIAQNLLDMSSVQVPIISILLGEGGSGGALALSIANIVMMFEHSIYSVISPEGCASILWQDATKAEQASSMLKYTAQDLKHWGIIDEIIPEPLGGCHIDKEVAAQKLHDHIIRSYNTLKMLPVEKITQERYRKFRNFGVYNSK